MCPDPPLSCALRAAEDVAVTVVLGKMSRFINMDIANCVVLGNMSIWTSSFPLLDGQQCFPGDEAQMSRVLYQRHGHDSPGYIQF